MTQKMSPAASSDFSPRNGGGSPAIFAVEPSAEMSWLRVVLITLAGVVSHTFGRGTMPLLLPAISDDLELTATTAGAKGSVNMSA